MKIVPAVLAENREDFLLRMRLAESFADYVQIDFMDGIFVPAKSVSPEEISAVRTSLSFELHLMADDPLSVMERIDNPGLRKVLFHFESGGNHGAFISAMRERGIEPGLAVKPETPLAEFRDAAREVGTLLFLTVDPGSYGSPFKPDVLDKVVETRQVYPEKTMAVDGGVSLDNLEDFLRIGVDGACVGSRIFLEGDPAENYRRFLDRVRELEK